jgi:hypothetical protein
MTLTHKIFLFLAICLVVKMVTPAVNTYSVPETVSEDANKCKNGDTTQDLTLVYKGKVIEQLTVQCPR